jgi:hypothetical protein
MIVDVQLYEGRSLDTVTQAETLAPYGDPIARDYVAYTAATAMLETAERLTEEREPAVQQFLLLAGGLSALAVASTSRAGAGLLPAAFAGRRGVGAELSRLRALWCPGAPACFQPRQWRHRLCILPATGLGFPGASHPGAAGGSAGR